MLGAAITCAGLALADAGIPMYDVITASTVGVYQNKILLDPSAFEEDLCSNGVDGTDEHGIIMMSRLSTHDQVSELWQSGALTFDSIQRANKILLATNQEIVPIIKQILVRKVVKNIKEMKKESTVNKEE